MTKKVKELEDRLLQIEAKIEANSAKIDIVQIELEALSKGIVKLSDAILELDVKINKIVESLKHNGIILDAHLEPAKK